MGDDLVEAIVAELFRLRARPDDVGQDAGIRLSRGVGGSQATLWSRRPDFHWTGDVTAALELLRQLPDDCGPERIRSEFA